MIPRATPAPITIPAATVRSLVPVLLGIGSALLIHCAVPTHGYAARIFFAMGINVILAVSLNIVNGFTGQFSMGHAGFMAVGAYASIVITYYGGYALFGTVDKNDAFSGYLLFFGSIVVGGIVAAIAGYLVGLPSLRLRGDYLAIVTLGFGEIIRVLVQVSRDSLDPGMIETVAWWKRPIYLGGSLGFIHGGSYNNLAWTWAGVAITLMVAYRLRQSTHGRAFLSVRENEIAAEAVGINTTRYAGTASRPEEFNFMKSFDAIIMVVLGGMGSISGATLAAIALTVLTEALRSFAEYRLISYALLLILVMILRPKGLFGTEEIWQVAPRIWRRFRGKK